MKLPSSIRKIKFFKKRDKRKEAQSMGAYAGNGGSGGGQYHQNQQSLHQQYSGGSGSAYGHGQYNHHGFGSPLLQVTSQASSRLLTTLPGPVLERIFTFVCPHTADETYETCEQSSIDDACMLCDLRDLAHCVAVCRQWRRAAIRRLYYSIRIDTVHYCEREIYLSDRRKRRSFFDRNGLPEDTAQARLKLLCRTLREDPTRLGALVHFLKTPYMLRESCQADLARTIAVLPNLRYVDLPEGLYTDEPPYLTLRLEVQARCHQLRKMTYMGGSERSLELLAKGNVWPGLEVLELVRIAMDPAVLRHVLGALPNLQALKVSETEHFTDDVLCFSEMLPDFPAVNEFILTDVPRVTAEGLRQYLLRPDARRRLRSLNLNGTGVEPWHLQGILAAAPRLEHLTVVAGVGASLPMAAGTHNIPPLASTSLRTLNYEITARRGAGGGAGGRGGAFAGGVTASYYNYLSGSLLSGGLPNLRAVYVRDAHFPDSLLGLPPPQPTFAADGFSPRRPSTAGSLASSPTGSGGFGSAAGLSPTSPRGFLSPGLPVGGGHLTNPFQEQPRAGGGGGLMAPPQMPWAEGGHNPRFSSNNPFASMMPTQQMHTLEVFTKGDDELDWSFVKVSPNGENGRASAMRSPRGSGGGAAEPARPHSSYGLSSDGPAAWGATAGARKSVFMGNGAGGFLAVPADVHGGGGGPGGGGVRRGSPSSLGGPGGGGRGGVGVGFGTGVGAGGGGGDEWPRPTSSAGRKDRMDLWR